MLRSVLIVLLLLLIAAPPPTVASAPLVAVSVPRTVDIDATGIALRRALNAYEEARAASLPTTWTRTRLVRGATATLGPRVLVRLDDVSPGGVRLLVVGDAGPLTGDLSMGDELTLDPLRFLLVGTDPRAGVADLMMMAAAPPPVLSDRTDRGASPVSIIGEAAARRLLVSGGDAEILAFAREFLALAIAGNDAETAARRARDKFPPRSPALAQHAPVATSPIPGYADSAPRGVAVAEEAFAAGVTLTLVRGESSALRQLSTGWAYDSEGRSPNRPRVGARSRPDGGATVTYGSPGDAFRARLDALEASGSVRVESSTYLHVPLDGGGASFAIAGTNAGASGYVRARPAGRNSVELDIATSNADRSSLGSINTRVRVRDGATVRLGGSTTTITSSSSSSAPIIGSVPYVGPLSGRSQSSSYASDYALFATVQLQ